MYLNSAIARKELVTVSRGKVSRVPVNVLAEYVLNYCLDAAPTPTPKSHDDSVQFLERLLSLEDPR